MTEATATATVRYDSIDECLGPAAGRFFGEGYKKVTHAISDVSLVHRPDGTGAVQATGELSYPTDWSRKSTKAELRPHLSSIDALLLGVQLAELYLTHAHGLTEAQRRRMWLRRFIMRAGSAPQAELTGIALHARRTEFHATPHTLCGHLSVLDSLIGTVRLRCEIEHETSTAPTPADTCCRTAEEILGPAEARYYGTGYKLRQHDIQNVAIGPDRRRLEAKVRVTEPVVDGAVSEGLGAAYQPALSMIDCMAATSQMAQVLLYQQDGVRRDYSNTLWMRRMAMDSKTPYQPLSNPFMTSALIDKTERVQFADGDWRTTRMGGDFQGIHAQTSLAHELPNG